MNLLAPTLPVVRLARMTDAPAMLSVRTAVKENTLTPAELAELGITPEAIAQAVASTPMALSFRPPVRLTEWPPDPSRKLPRHGRPDRPARGCT